MSKNKKQIIERINFLINFAISENNKKDFKNPYIYDYIKIAFRLAQKINYRLPNNIHLKVCKNCYCIRNSENTKYRLENRKKNNKEKKYLKIHCLCCDSIKKIKIT